MEVMSLIETDIADPWVVLLVGAFLVFAVCMAFPAVGVVLVLRRIFEGEFYLGPYQAFEKGTGFGFAASMTVAFITISGGISHRFYFEPWFGILLVLLYLGVVLVSRKAARDAKDKGRPPEADKQWAERYYNYFGLPLAVTLAFVANVVTASEEFWLFVLLSIPIDVAWGYVFFIVDGKVEVPQDMRQWRVRSLFKVVVLGAAAAGLSFGFGHFLPLAGIYLGG